MGEGEGESFLPRSDGKGQNRNEKEKVEGRIWEEKKKNR